MRIKAEVSYTLNIDVEIDDNDFSLSQKSGNFYYRIKIQNEIRRKANEKIEELRFSEGVIIGCSEKNLIE